MNLCNYSLCNLKKFLILPFFLALPVYSFTANDNLVGCVFEDNYIDITTACFDAKGDGISDDTYSINKALEAIANNGTIFLPEGVYLISDSNGLKLMGKSGVTLTSEKAVIKSENVKYFHKQHLVPLLHIDNCHNCTIENIVFDGTNTTDFDVSALLLEDTKNAKILNTEAFGFSGNAAYGEANCENNLWYGNTARDSRVNSKSRGFWLGNGQIQQFTKSVKFHKNIALNNAATGIVLFSEGSEAINNVSSYNNGSGIIHGGSKGFQVKDGVVENNQLEGNLFYGYQNDSYSGFGEFVLTDIYIKKNYIHANLSGGILLYNSTNQIISDNLIKNNRGPGIVLERNLHNVQIIRNEIINDNGEMMQTDGIQANPHHSSQDNIIIENNIIRSPQKYAIELRTVTSDAELKNFTIIKNIFDKSEYGVYSANQGDLDNFKLLDNIFSQSRIRDIRLTGIRDSKDIELNGNTWDHDYSDIDYVKTK